ncbi:MAG: tetratricopeptide repeat protein [Verrucomicrobiales bacterium]|nr:tetratricopeptide repeat protein [Verrucomicrobiales bacterium]
MTFPKPGGSGNRPGSGDRPSISPGRPGSGGGIVDRPGNRPGKVPDRPDFGNRPGGDYRPGQGNRPDGGKPWWDNHHSQRPGGGVVNININNNFQKSINWSTNRNYWGYNPWWNRPSHYPWYGGSWNCGWRRPPVYLPPRWPGYFSGPTAGEVVAWGLVGWGLGNLIFDCGYSHYHNPYPVQPVAVSSGTSVTYSQPVTVVAVEAAPQLEDASDEEAEKTELLINESLSHFKGNDYLTALEGVDRAIAESPGDGAFHEYRALVLFALGQYGEAAGVLNPLLASSPGWDWSTMIQLYPDADTYTAQLRRLESYAKTNSESASAQFLLGYHYMVCTYLDQAAVAFGRAAELEPADRIAVQMARLASASTTAGDNAETPEDYSDAAEPLAPVELDQILGAWNSDNGENGVVTLVLTDEGGFSWSFDGSEGEPFEMKGEFNLGQANVLTLDANESQMAGTVSVTPEGSLNFVLAGGPPGDPGLQFKRG